MLCFAESGEIMKLRTTVLVVTLAIALASAGCREPVPDPLVLNERGLAAMSKDDVDIAIQLYDTAIKLKPNFPNGFRNRGIAYATKGDYARAIENYDQAIKLMPEMHSAYNSRGVANQLAGNFDRAVADFDQALKLKPDYAIALRNRGRTQFLRGHFAEAAADLKEGVRSDSTNAYLAIWLYMARRHLGQDGAKDLAAQLARSDSVKWPAPVARYYLGRMTEEQLVAAAEKTDAPGRADQRCAAAFYIGETALWKKQIDAAKARFREAATSCPSTSNESLGARAALRRLAGG